MCFLIVAPISNAESFSVSWLTETDHANEMFSNRPMFSYQRRFSTVFGLEIKEL